MKLSIKNIHSIGYSANNNPNRARKGGEETEGLIPAPVWRNEVVKRNADVSQTVAEMTKLIRESAWQTKQLSARLLGKDLYTTCQKIWEFLFDHILYKEDDKGKEQLRTPALSWHLRRTRGIDCDDFSIFASTILLNLGIPHYLRIARYPGKDYFQHVYVVVPQKGERYITIDAVLDEYDSEKPTAETKDFLVMDNNNLNGIDVSVLGSTPEDETLNQLSSTLEGKDFDIIEGLEGLEGLENVEELEGLEGEDGDVILGAIYRHLERTRDLVRKNPDLVSTVEDPDTLGKMLDYGLLYWNTESREKALGILADKENELNTLLGLDALEDGGEETQLFYGIEGLDGVSVLGKVKAKKQFFNKVKQTVQKVQASVKRTSQKAGTKIKTATKKAGTKAKKVAKKVGKAIVKNNPVSVSARLGMLAAMKTNFLQIASKIKWGYLTESEAKQRGFDMVEWRKSKEALTKAEKLFVGTLKGNAENFKKAILTGRAGGLAGVYDDLGVVAAATATASMTAAMPFLKQLTEFVKLINPARLIAKAKQKKANKKAAAETMPEASEEAQSAQPDAPESSAEGSPQEDATESPAPESSNAETDPGSSEENNASSSKENPSEEPESTTGVNNSNLPAAKSSGSPAPNPGPGEAGPVAKVFNWIKENPGKSALITAGGLLLIFGINSAVSDKPRPSFGKRGRGKSKKGKKKNNPPRAISGVKERKKRKPPYKNNTRKRKGGSPKKITL